MVGPVYYWRQEGRNAKTLPGRSAKLGGHVREHFGYEWAQGESYETGWATDLASPLCRQKDVSGRMFTCATARADWWYWRRSHALLYCLQWNRILVQSPDEDGGKVRD